MHIGTEAAAARPPFYAQALRVAATSADPAEIMRAHCDAVGEMLDAAALDRPHGMARLGALLETLRLAADRFAAPATPTARGPQAIVPLPRTELPRGCQRGEFHWTLHQESVFRPLVQQFGQDAEWLRTALLRCCTGESWRPLTAPEVAVATTDGGYDARHLAAIAAALRGSRLAHRLRTGVMLALLDQAQECLA